MTASSIDDAASRSSQRGDLTVDGTWDMGDQPDRKLTIIHADNPVVRDLINGRDEDQTPAGFNPDHATGDTGNAYAYGQCTWWAYVRRTQLGLPVGSHLGDGGMWADSAKALGYWVDDTPRQGDVIVFSPAQVNNAWGHVAIVEKVNGDDSIEISEANVNGQVGPFRRTIEAKQTHEYQYIHY
ncbi:CHAP domain-containing protein [Bifidobacterium longum]|uniref:CHAP domain-containing protein n=1 Tax=Bifidobacterium longum TaxID=216816 RepID=UPI001F6203CB|nr:CHAP domain-containing protein [Bifidobacterium longum]